MKVIDRILAGQRPLIHGDGTQVFDFVYVDDVGEANVLAMKADCADEFFNVGMGKGTSLNDLVAILLEMMDSDLKPEYQPQAQQFVTHRIGSTEKATKLLGFKAHTELREGIKRVVDWRLSAAGKPR
jgi:UDP-glucose 4-epimerase